jgi:hypothetical protein
MEKKRKLNLLSISDKVRLIQLVDKGDGKNVKSPMNLIFHQTHYRQLLNRKRK